MEGKHSTTSIRDFLTNIDQQYEKDGRWVYEQHPFWCTGYTFWDLHSEAPDLFLHLSRSDLVFFKGDLNHRKLTYDCAAPASTPFDVAVGPMASAPGAPKVCSLRTIKSDVVVGLGDDGDGIAEKLDQEEPGWKISGKYVRVTLGTPFGGFLMPRCSGCCSPIRRSPRGKGAICVVGNNTQGILESAAASPSMNTHSFSSINFLYRLCPRPLYFLLTLCIMIDRVPRCCTTVLAGFHCCAQASRFQIIVWLTLVRVPCCYSVLQ
jgi:hypothetical protein